MSVRAPIAVALDAPDLATACRWAGEVEPIVSTLKVGLELFYAIGIDGLRLVRQTAPTCSLFLDVKLHDIPTTVRGAAQVISAARADIVTVHALGGPSMIAAAREALPEADIAAVTVLTSMTADDLAKVGVSGAPLAAVLQLARMAVDAGAQALVCSPREVAQVREAVGPDVRLITPGVRPVGASAGDQQRVATPAQALADGADLLVIGRPITASAQPAVAAAEIAADIAASG